MPPWVPPPPPDQSVYHARTHFFSRQNAIFSMGGTNSRNQERGVIFQAWVREILKMSTILHVFISIFLFRMFELLWMNVFHL